MFRSNVFYITLGDYTVLCAQYELPNIYDSYREHAVLCDDINLDDKDGTIVFVAIARQGAWPFLVVTQRARPLSYGFNPGAILIPETELLMIGAGERLLAYDLIQPKRLWEDKADVGFWRWQRHADVIVMAAELEMAAWDLQGRKLWSVFVEPPWDYSVRWELVDVDVMGKKSTFSLVHGPDYALRPT